MKPDPDYYYKRAEEQLVLAQAATHPSALRSHFMLAEKYIELAYSEGSPDRAEDPA